MRHNSVLYRDDIRAGSLFDEEELLDEALREVECMEGDSAADGETEEDDKEEEDEAKEEAGRGEPDCCV